MQKTSKVRRKWEVHFITDVFEKHSGYCRLNLPGKNFAMIPAKQAKKEGRWVITKQKEVALN